MTHPSDTDLALYGGGDLKLWERWRVGRHVDNCAQCSAELASFRTIRSDLAGASNRIPEGLRWDRLADEMVANINVGLQAGECVTPVHTSAARVDWRAAAVMAGMSLVLLAAWYLNPMPRSGHGALPGIMAGNATMRAPKVEIRTTSAGLEVNENGNAMVLLNGSSGRPQRTMIVSSPGSLRARFVDGDTGQITINNVYSE